jgi:hypothetical protein
MNSINLNSDWEEQYAYTLGVQAYIYGFPWIYLSQLLWLWTTPGGKALSKSKNLDIPWAPLNTFFNAPALASPEIQTGGSPNVDTLYSPAWLDLGPEPIILSVPEVSDRYYSMQMAGIDSDNFAYVGSYATGSAAAHYLIGGPGWMGTVPVGVLDVLPRSRTPFVLILGRTGVNNNSQSELDKARAIQQRYRLTKLSDWVGADRLPERPERADVPVGFDYNDTSGAWLTMNRAMSENPPGVPPGISQRELLRLFATIGVGPNQHVLRQSPATLRGLQRAAEDGLSLLRHATKCLGKNVNNWTYPPLTIGRAGQDGDFIVRAALQALAGIVANDPSEAVYINASTDSEGRPLESNGRYIMTFDPNMPEAGFPPYNAAYFGFWSVTLYQSDYNLLAGSKHYTVNSYDPRFKELKDDGSLSIILQSEQPAAEKGIYWLQTPSAPQGGAGTSFFLILRVYVPAPEVAATQTWKPPRLQRTG